MPTSTENERECRTIPLRSIGQKQNKPYLHDDIMYLIADYLSPVDLLTYIRAIPPLAHLLTKKQINNRGHDGSSLLHLIVSERDTRMAKILVTNAIDPNIPDGDKATAFSLAVNLGYEDMVKLFLECSQLDINAVDNQGFTALMAAVRKEYETIVDTLLEREDIDFNIRSEKGDTALLIAIGKGSSSLAKALLRRKDLDASFPDHRPLFRAIYHPDASRVELLLGRKEVDINCKTDTRRTMLMQAAEIGHHEAVRLLLSREDLDVNAADDRGDTALIIAIFRGFDDIASLLMEREDLDMNFQMYDGTALMHAARTGFGDLVYVLLNRRDTDINAQDRHGRTALMFAARDDLGYTKTDSAVHVLLAREDIDVNIRDRRGRTALMIAAEAGQRRNVDCLLRMADIDVDIQDVVGATALTYAASEGHELIEEILRSHIEARTQSLSSLAIKSGNIICS
ncbi:ankyrin repeat domain-containing protein 44 [Arthroderma uncinatum]|uniref:ankyrin repeat domain-containing protein 44 n=1 Tax=Arthroderma uncinatum TaxID=74035 RepID=UPI00144AEE30|nr:ankyrin repeat domain-containing protein 44 [Arthroderma uncinatum]KAF3483101.1 ankyrin repeat domain-containing protein 44 [Arthroderma uncinatum]